jgi:ribonuclease D
MGNADTHKFNEKLPFGRFQGKVTVIEFSGQVENVVNKLMKNSILGFDTETRPSFRKGPRNKTSLLQFCTVDEAFLFRINKTGFHPASIKLFENEEVLKIGVAIHDDLGGLKRLKQFKENGFIDLQNLSKSLSLRSLSLKGLSEEVLNLRVSKRQRLTNWEAYKLTPAQINYAATDAWITLCIYNQLIKSQTDISTEK